MCGIVGSLRLDGPPPDLDLVGRLALLQTHRGPDQSGMYDDDTVALASQRLAIIDVKGGGQPIPNEDGSIQVVYNGELYNYRELRAELRDRGHRFATSTDTEVFVHAYEEWDAEFLRKLNGMFAVALWDRRRRRLLLARDHLGMKPLYHTVVGGSLWFASEVKTLLSLPLVRPVLDATVLSEYLTYQNVLSGRCFLKHIESLPPATYLLAENGRVAKRTYWDVPLGQRRAGTVADHIAEYRVRTEAAVERHLISDVAVGSYLSGGLDSAAVVLCAAPHLEGRLETFTGAFDHGGFYDERPLAREVAARANAAPHEIVIGPDAFWDALDPVCWALDEPSVGSGAIPQYLVAQAASRRVKVILTGHGGDELLLGYEAFKALHVREALLRDGMRALPLLGTIRRRELPRWAYFVFTRDPVRRQGLVRLFGAEEVDRLLAPALRSETVGYDPLRALDQLTEPLAGASATERASYVYLKTYLRTLLIQEDKVGMAHSIESRMPLCDRELVEFLASVPPEHKLHDGELKYFAKTAFVDVYPPALLRAPKRGFPTPIVEWFRGPLRTRLEARLFGRGAATADVFDVEVLRRLWEEFVRGRLRGPRAYFLANRLYSLLTIVVWHELFALGRPHSRR